LKPVACPPLRLLKAQRGVVVGVHHIVGSADRLMMLFTETVAKARNPAAITDRIFAIADVAAFANFHPMRLALHR